MAEDTVLSSFMGHILEVKAPYGSIAFNDIGASGVPNIAAEQTNKLYQAAHAFAQACTSQTRDEQTLGSLASAVEAQLMVLVTIGVISAGRADGLIDELRGVRLHQA